VLGSVGDEALIPTGANAETGAIDVLDALAATRGAVQVIVNPCSGRRIKRRASPAVPRVPQRLRLISSR
jgi:hypothetical protein